MTRHARPMWHQAYDAQMGLWRWYRQRKSWEWLLGLYEDGTRTIPEPNREAYSRMYDAELGRLIDMDPIFVSADMAELVDVARVDFKPEPLLESDLPTPRGFVYFAKPVTINDKYGHELPVSAVGWSHQYELKDDDPKVLAEAIERLGGKLAFDQYGPRFTATEADAMVADGLLEAFGVQVGLYAEPQAYLDVAMGADAKARRPRTEQWWIDKRAEEDARTAGTPLVPIHVCPWHYHMEFDGNEVDTLGEPTGASQWWSLLQTTLRLMQQRLTSKGFGRPERAQRREAQRLGFPPETEVVIVRLRGEEQERKDPTGEEARYSHRFIVGGHWRNQWYPSIQQHRQIRIAPYVKGDPGLPLIVRPRRVFQWTR